MLYEKRFELIANEPQTFSTINMSSSRNHFLQINDDSQVTVRVTLRIGEPAVDIDTVTGPGLFNIHISPQQFELVASTNTTVVLSGS